MENLIIIVIIVLIVFTFFYFKKDNFKSVQQETQEDYENYYRPYVFTNQTKPAQKNQEVTKTELATLFKEIITYAKKY